MSNIIWTGQTGSRFIPEVECVECFALKNKQKKERIRFRYKHIDEIWFLSGRSSEQPGFWASIKDNVRYFCCIEFVPWRERWPNWSPGGGHSERFWQLWGHEESALRSFRWRPGPVSSIYCGSGRSYQKSWCEKCIKKLITLFVEKIFQNSYLEGTVWGFFYICFLALKTKSVLIFFYEAPRL